MISYVYIYSYSCILCWLPEPTQIAINDLNLDQLDETLLEMWDSQIPTAQKK